MKMTISLPEAAAHFGLTEEQLWEWISLRWICPVDENNIFDEEDLARIQLIQDLREDLGVNDEAVPIILHLVDQLNRLHYELRRSMGD